MLSTVPSSLWPIAFGIGSSCAALAALWRSVRSDRRNSEKTDQEYTERLEERLEAAEERLEASERHLEASDRRLKDCETARTRFERLYYELLAEIREKGHP